MIKKIKVAEDATIEINSNSGWLYTYKENFGHDILAILMPGIEAGLKAAGHVAQGLPMDRGEYDIKDIMAALDDDTIGEVFISLAGLEITTLYNMIWALAKNADESIPDPKTWFNSFECFYIDDVAPKCLAEVVRASAQKKTIQKLMGNLKAMGNQSASTESQSQQLTEDSQ